MIRRADRTYTKEEVMGLMEPLVSAWFDERFGGLTEPQARAVPIIHARGSVLVSSPTGSGKTLTAFMSIINELTRYASEGTLEERIYCVYISPLKALANDVNRNLNTPLAEMREVAARKGMNVPDIRVAVRSGDTSQYDRQKMLRHPPHILITTPESLALVLEAPKFREKLSKMEWLILDEIHDICDSKRGAFLSLTLERLQEFCETDFVRIGLSATLAPIEAIAGYLAGLEGGEPRDVAIVESDSKKELDLQVICPTEDMTALPSDIVNSMMYDKLKELVDAHETTLVFTNTRSGAESVVYKLKERGLENVAVHHSSLGKETRLDVEERLKRGEIKCVVSSTSLELGIDIGSVDLVCQIGSPKSVAKGLQRIGRSGHSMGRVAKGRLLVFDPDDLVECAVMCRAAHRGDIDRVAIPENCLDVLAQTVVGMSLGSRWDVDDAYALVRRSYCYRSLPRDRFVGVLKYLGSKDEYEGVYSKIWYDEEEGRFGRRKGSRMIYYMNIGTIPEEANYRVVTNHGSTAGELSEKFVERLAPGDIFVLGGRSFEFVRSKGMIAHVKEASGRKPTVPSWAGEMLPRSFDLSMDIARFRRELSSELDGDEAALRRRLCADLDIDAGSARSLISYFKEQMAVAGMVPDDRRLAVEEYIDPSGNQRLVFHFPFGRRVNDALSRGYAYRMSNAVGANVSVTVSDDSFMIGLPRRMDPAKVSGLLSSADLEPVLRKAVRDSEIFKLRFRHTAARSFMILRSYMGRSISVNRQQTRSSYLLEALGGMENMPVIEETYREVLEDDMDIRNARSVLEGVEAGRTAVAVIPYAGTPSPFAHSAILSGFSDIVLMEDRSALLRELHRKVLSRAMGAAVREFEFDEDQVVPYFREKIGRAACKDDVPALLSRTGPLQVLRERGRNLYAYADADRRTVDGWVRELLKEGRIASVFLDDPHVMTAEEAPYYRSACRRERELSEADGRLLAAVGDGTFLPDAAEAAGLGADAAYRSMRKLESMGLVVRTGISGSRWLFGRAPEGGPDPELSAERVIMRHLECFAPATAEEIAFALALPEARARAALAALVGEGEAVSGRFLVSEGEQYMRKIDRMRLRAGKSDVFDFETVERYRFSKGAEFDSIEDFFAYYGSAGSEIDVYNRVRGFDLKEWYAMRADGRILLGRFVRGRVRFVLAADGDRYAAIRSEEVLPEDEELLSLIAASGAVTMHGLLAATGMEKGALKESIMRLDRALRVVRTFDEREDWGTANSYSVYRPSPPEGDPARYLVRQALAAYGPMPASAFRHLLGIPADEAAAVARELGAATVLVGEGQAQMLVMPEEVPLMSEPVPDTGRMRVYSPFDPDLASKWAELSSRYGDRWVYPLVMDSRVVGAAEIWEMSGCIEVRSLDLDSPDLLPGALDAFDWLMGYFRMKGIDIVRVREVMSKDASELGPDAAAALEAAGYSMVNGFYAKGACTGFQMDEAQLVSYVLHRQRALPSERYFSVLDVLATRGYVRNDAELLTRSSDRTPMRVQRRHAFMRRAVLIPEYVGFATREQTELIREAKGRVPEGDAARLMSFIEMRQPVSRAEILDRSGLPAGRAAEALKELFHATAVFQRSDGRYAPVRPAGVGRYEAVKRIAMQHFRDFGIFSAEKLSLFLSMGMPMARRVLADLEAEGALVKGFFLKGSPTVYWMLKEDAGRAPEPAEGMLVLNSQDNLHVYLRDWIKREAGGRTDCVVLDGPRIVGSFKGKLTASGAKVEGFEGTPEPRRFVNETAVSLGVARPAAREADDRDWDVSELYLKFNPGARRGRRRRPRPAFKYR